MLLGTAFCALLRQTGALLAGLVAYVALPPL